MLTKVELPRVTLALMTFPAKLRTMQLTHSLHKCRFLLKAHYIAGVASNSILPGALQYNLFSHIHTYVRITPR